MNQCQFLQFNSSQHAEEEVAYIINDCSGGFNFFYEEEETKLVQD